MLQVKDLSKVYKPKKGVPVTALDRVSIAFAEKGMVFLLGKSGSGKSTLLNLLGGLDSATSGEIIISGVSSRFFRQSDFDSYRNTLVGFIFQEYNVLDEFTVGANIALALELQGKKATDEAVSEILRQVDLVDFGARRPNELSGGQKQRVAIARALVKNPKIIMADEPTGALDSATGRQVLDTLQKLSREKLVIVVSHDRDFAEQYADRIIELADGKVISDREFFTEEAECAFSPEGVTFGEGEITVSSGYRLTEEDRIQINEYLSALAAGEEVKIRAISSRIKRQSRNTQVTEPEKREPIRFIPSRLPLKAAFRIGAGALGHKKIRLVFTILLSCIAFGLFGLADTFGAYDHITTCVRSIMDSGIHYASVEKTEKYVYGEGEHDFYYSSGGKIKEEELDRIARETGVLMEGVFCPRGGELGFQALYDTSAEFTQSDYHIYPYDFNGFSEIDEKFLRDMNLSLLAGRLPEGDKNEIAISSYICETFYIGGFAKEGDDGKISYDKISRPEDMLGKVFSLCGTDYTVVGVVSSGFDLERYRALTEKEEGDSTADMLIKYALYSELDGIRSYSLSQVAMVGKGHLEALLKKESPFGQGEYGFVDVCWKDFQAGEEFYYGFGADYYGILSDAKRYPIVWVNGEKSRLEENEIILSLETILGQIGFSSENPEAYDPKTGRLIFSKMTEEEQASLITTVSQMGPFTLQCYSHRAYKENGNKVIENVRIVGILLPDETGLYSDPGNVMILHDSIAQMVTRADDGIYSYAVGQMPKDREGVERVVTFTTNQDKDIRYELQNPVMFELEAIHEVLLVLSKVFLYIGLGFAVFAAFLLANFIGTSIAYKKQQIGILRAIGARGGDVFRIFFSESFCIAMINFVLSGLGTFLVVALINYVIRMETGILITLLTFSLRQVVLLLGVSLLVAALASFIPVKKIASKKPIDAIRGR